MVFVSSKQSGNIFFALLGAVALVGVVGASSNTILRGPVRSMHAVTQKTIAENQMIAAARLALMAAVQQEGGGDCDLDGTVEPVPFSTTGEGPFPAGGGYLPNGVGASKSDPWGNTYGYCVWDHGTAVHSPSCGANRLRGAEDGGGIVIAVISSGPDRAFQTSCGDHPDYLVRPSGSDDIVQAYTYGEAQGLAGGLWLIKTGDPDTAEIGQRNIEVAGSGGSGDAARIGFDEALHMSGVGSFLATKTDNIYARTPGGAVMLQSPLQVQSVAGLDAPDGGTGGLPACENGEIVQWQGGEWACNDGSGLDNLDAGNLKTGTIPPARMGSGAPDSTTFLRGDGTWVNYLPHPPACTGDSKALQWDGSAWDCADIEGGSGEGGNCSASTVLVAGAKTCGQCIDAGGRPYETTPGSGDWNCQFNQATCPSGWTKHANWSATSPRSCSGTGSGCPPPTCTTGGHAYSDKATETCTYARSSTYYGGDDNYCHTSTQRNTCTALVIQIGCY